MVDFSQSSINGRPLTRGSNAKLQVNQQTIVYIHLTNWKKSRLERNIFFLIKWDDKSFASYFGSSYYGREIPSAGKNIVDYHIMDPDYFVVEILIDNNGEQITFSPTEICLSLSAKGKGNICPTEWIPPAQPFLNTLQKVTKVQARKIWSEGGNISNMCDNDFTRLQFSLEDKSLKPRSTRFVQLNKSTKVDIAKNVTSCVALRYPISPPDPNDSFSLNIHELRVNNNIVELPAIEYTHDQQYFSW